MNRLVHVLLNGSKTLIVGLSLVALPWLGSIYLCSGATDNDPAADCSLLPNPEQSKASPPHLLPVGDSARCMLVGDAKPQPILAAEFSAQQTDDSPSPKTEQNDLADGPVLTDPVQAEKSQSAFIPPSGIVAEKISTFQLLMLLLRYGRPRKCPSLKNRRNHRLHKIHLLAMLLLTSVWQYNRQTNRFNCQTNMINCQIKKIKFLIKKNIYPIHLLSWRS